MPTLSFSWMNQNEPCVNSKKSSKKAVSSISIFSITMHSPSACVKAELIGREQLPISNKS